MTTASPIVARARDIEIAERCVRRINEVTQRRGERIDARLGPNAVIVSRLSRPDAAAPSLMPPVAGSRPQERRVAERRAAILRILAGADDGLSAAALADATGYSADETSYLVRILADFGAIVRVEPATRPCRWRLADHARGA